MIAYFDTSALVPLLVKESGSERASLLWNQADHVVAIRLVYVEGCAALAMATRLGRLNQSALPGAIRGLDQLYQQMDIVEVSDNLVRRAGALAEEFSLRGYDAAHLAAAETLSEAGIVLVAGDAPLALAAAALGLAVARI